MLKINSKRQLLYPNEVLEKVYTVADNVSLLQYSQNFKISSHGIIAICLVRNGEYYIKEFIEHYLHIGVQHIVFMDNGSNDLTLKIAAQYRHVTVVQCSLPFREFKLAMRIYLAEKFCYEKWCLSIDIDEFWDYPLQNFLSLSQFIKYLECYEYTAVVAQQLDLFPKGIIYKKDGPDLPLKDLCYYDLSDLYCWRINEKKDNSIPDDRIPRFYAGNTVTNVNIPVMARGIRWRLFKITPILTKTPLFKVVSSVTPFLKSSHRIHGAVLADISCVLRHLLLTNRLAEKASWCAEQSSYYDNSVHYKQISCVLNDINVLVSDSCNLYIGAKDLVRYGFINITENFISFASSYVLHSNNEANRGEDISLHS